MKGIKGNVFLITGISSGIGAAIAKEILENGGEVIGTFRNEEAEELIHLRTLKNIKLLQWDSKNEPDFIFDIPKLNGWVHCIGRINPFPIKYLKSDETADLLEVNFLSAVQISSNLLLNKKLNPNSSVVFISSVSSHFPYPGGSIYAASKAALESFSKSLALECAKQKIRVNTLVCGLVNTSMLAASKKVFNNDEMDLILKKYPLGIGEPHDIAGPCLFLLSEMSSWVTGTVVTLDGGLMLNTTK